jgi:hypothetical protein
MQYSPKSARFMYLNLKQKHAKKKTRITHTMYYEFPVLSSRDCLMTEFLKFVGPRGQKIMRSANNVGPVGVALAVLRLPG